MTTQVAPPRPVRPRDAASLVVLRKRRRGTEVLLGRRHSRHRFLPDVYVFPGGRLDRQDYRTPLAAALRPEVAARLERHWPSGKAQGLAVAAARETFEETGLAFGAVDEGRLVPHLESFDYIARAITPPDSPIRFHARFFLADVEAAGGHLRDSAELQDLKWVSLSEALGMPLIDVTEFVLQEISRRLGGWRAPGVPFFHFRQGVARVRYE
jgi:8-oxo-dGTP pyrophosphatase MutT (NUDIX family)